MVAPDRLGVIGEGTETIATPEGAFMKGRDGKWKQFRLHIAKLLAAYRSQEMVDQFDKLNRDFKDLGSVSIDGTPVVVYEFHCDLHGPCTTTKLWVGKERGLPLQQEVRGGGTTSTERIEYDAAIKIMPPTPARSPKPAGKSTR